MGCLDTSQVWREGDLCVHGEVTTPQEIQELTHVCNTCGLCLQKDIAQWWDQGPPTLNVPWGYPKNTAKQNLGRV